MDDESKHILKIWEKTIFSGYNEKELIKKLILEGKAFSIPELSYFFEEGWSLALLQLDKGVCASDRMEYTQILLEHSEWKGKWRFISLKNLEKKAADEIIIPIYSSDVDISSLKEMYGDIFFIPKYADVLMGILGKQYFDVFTADDKEVICDAGAYDGVTESLISEWSNNSYKRIYAFEPNAENCNVCKEYYKNSGIRDVILIEKGTWSTDTTLYFDQEEISAGGRLSEEGRYRVPVTTIDSAVSEDKITYIKMDVEGAELESLKGASNTIIKDAPKLAICIYHKKEDLWKIPKYILSLNKNYRFYVRHYTSYIYETVLYAVVM